MQPFNALMPGEHDWMKGKPMPGQAAQPAVAPKRNPVMNALSAVFEYGAPEAYEAGRQKKITRELGNRLAGGDVAGAGQYALQQGNLDQGLQLQGMAGEQDAARRKQEAQGVVTLFSQGPEFVNRYAMEDPAGFQRQTGMTAEEYLQAAGRFGDGGQQFAQYAMQKAQAELGQAATQQEYMAPIEGVDAEGNPVYYQPSKSGAGRRIEDVMPVKQEAEYASAADATGVRRYIEGPQIGKPVPGFETPRPERGGMTVGVDENGNPVIVFGGPGQGSAFGSSGDRTGASAFGSALESAGTADTTLALANQAKAIIEGGYQSGALAGLKGEAGRVLGEFGIGDKNAVADYEQFQAINNQLAAQMLKLFGGSDTERELAISISSNIGPRFSEETNTRMLAALEKTVATQRQKPEFIAQWTRRHGSLDAIDQTTGLGFQATWDRYLQEQAGMYTNAANDAAQVGMEGAAQGALPADKMRRLEELRAKRDAGRLQ
jgi:hypothetical protein